MTFTIVLIPLLSGFIGWGTNLLAVRMLFRPYLEYRLLGVRVQGLIPARKSEIAHRISEAVDEKLLTPEEIRDTLQSPEVAEKLVTTIEEDIESFFDATLRKVPLVSKVLGSSAIKKVKSLHLQRLEQKIPKVLGAVSKPLLRNVSFKEAVRRKIESYDMKELEELVYHIASKELRAIEILGAVLGFLVGLVQVGVMIWFLDYPQC